ncbi:MAG TPA: GntR family transcriptional regulator [Anaerolineales bacterium]|jgi:DNA-binding GntR family transcriptional regulator|nr:GntR family transcriptional regulator [Anaerolineales bacterium]
MSENTKNKIYQEVRRSIIMGQHKTGTRLNIEEIAKRHQTSVTPVRDALQMLSQEGLVTIRPRAGYFITRITLKELRDMFELRNILELAAIERSVEQISEEQIAQLRKIHAGYTGDDDESYERYTDENQRFHCLLAEASGNQELAQLIGHLMDRLARFMVLRHAGKTMEASHTRILEALEQRDRDAARQALIEDIEGTQQAALDKIIQTEAATWHLEI